MKKNTNRLVVVLGMHRSGTSAITRGLQVMGVELGESLLPPQGDNISGFWEDEELNRLNIEMLESLNSDWHFLAPIQLTDVEQLQKSGYQERAVGLLQKKMSGVEIFGFKDPRVAKLLPFWTEVFSTIQTKVSYVIVIRHPLSVCRSLEKRHGFDFEKSSLLWLEHVINSLTCTDGNNRVVVDYDYLIQTPGTVLERIAQELQLRIDLPKLETFRNDFLKNELRHTKYQVDDLVNEVAIVPLVREIYSCLLEIVEGRSNLTDKSIQLKIEQWTNEFARFKPTLVLIDKLNSRLGTIIEENNRLAKELYEKLAVKDMELNNIYKSRAWWFITTIRSACNRLRQIQSFFIRR